MANHDVGADHAVEASWTPSLPVVRRAIAPVLFGRRTRSVGLAVVAVAVVALTAMTTTVAATAFLVPVLVVLPSALLVVATVLIAPPLGVALMWWLSPAVRLPETLRVDGHGITSVTARETVTVKWSEVRQVRETADALVLTARRVRRRLFVTVPHRDLPLADRTLLRALVAEHGLTVD